MYRLIWIILCSTSLFAQSSAYKVAHYQSTDGLPSDVILMTFKKDGFLYLATQKGLSMYDGYIFVHSSNIPNTILSIAEKDGKIYGEEAGVGLFETNDIYSPKKIVSSVNYYDDTPDNDHYKNIYKDNQGNIWCTDYHFLKYINPAEKKQKSFRIALSNTQIGIKANYFETETELLIAGTLGLFVWDKKTDKLVKRSSLDFSDIIENKGKILLLAKDGHIHEYNEKAQQLSLLKKTPLNNFTLFADSFIPNQFFILYDSKKIYHYYLDNNELNTIFESEDIINHVFFDKETNLFWISTQKGLVKLMQDKGIVSTITLRDNSKTPVTDIIEEKNGVIWLIKNYNSLYRISTDGIRKELINNERLNRLSYSDNQLLLATNTGVFRKEPNGNFKKIISTDYSVTKAIYYEQKYWLMPEIGLMKVYDSESLKEIPVYVKNNEDFYKGNLFNDMTVSTDNQLWLASWMPRDFGISKYNSAQREFSQIGRLFGNGEKFVADYYNQVIGLRNGNTAFSSTGGFNIVSPQGEIVYSMDTRVNKILSDNTMGIGEDKNGNIWFGCAEGLYLYNLKENKPTRISKTEGLHSNNVTYGFLIDKNNELYVSNEHTLEKINLNKILNTELIEKLEISAIKVIIHTSQFPPMSYP